MAELNAHDIAERLLADRLRHSSPDVLTLTDPIVDTPMVVTLEQLRPYELNPRTTRNPRYDEIKASIRERGLDTPPPITRRPGAPRYIIRNGGNTRLAVLNELWSETRDERFFRVNCLFRPWTARGEIVALTGHLAENELHGGLSFIERSLGVQKARELYEEECAQPLTQRELARRLTSDGYPISQPQISRMRDTIQHLLPAIPSALYGGLGRPQVVRLLVLRSTAEGIWNREQLTKSLQTEFSDLFQEILLPFDGDPETFRVERVRDELIGQMSRQLQVPHLALAVEFGGADWKDPLTRDPGSERVPDLKAAVAPGTTATAETRSVGQMTGSSLPHGSQEPRPPPPHGTLRAASPSAPGRLSNESLRNHSHSLSDAAPAAQADTRDRRDTTACSSLERTVEAAPDRRAHEIVSLSTGDASVPSDLWYIDPVLDDRDSLRAHISDLVEQIASEASAGHRIERIDIGLGFVCREDSAAETPPSAEVPSVLILLHALSMPYLPAGQMSEVDSARLAYSLGPLLQGSAPSERVAKPGPRLSDSALRSLIRLIRLARRLLELESDEPDLTEG